MKKICLLIFIFIAMYFLILPNNANFAYSDEILDQTVSKTYSDEIKMDFQSSVYYSLKNNNEIRAYRKNLSSTERNIGIERSNLLPKVGFNENFVVTNNPTEALVLRSNQSILTEQDLELGTLNYPGVTTNFLTNISVNQVILDPKSMIRLKIAKKEYSENGYFYLRKEEDLINQIAQAYIKVEQNKELILVDTQALDDIKAHLENAKERYKKKQGLYSDIERGESAIKRQEEKLIWANRNYVVAKRNLGLLLGFDEKSIDIVKPIPIVKLVDIKYYKTYSQYRTDVKAMEIRVENAKNKVQEQKTEWLPTLNASANYNFYQHNFPFGGEGNSYIAGVFFNWKALDGNKRKYEILKAQDKQEEAKEQLEWLRKNVSFKVFEAYSDVEANERRLKLAIGAQKNALETMKLVEDKWRNSQLPLVSLVDAQSNLNETRENVVICKNDLRSALLTLYYESGIISHYLLIK